MKVLLALFLLSGTVYAESFVTCFPPVTQTCDQRLVKFIQSARVSLDVAIYDLNLQDVADAIIERSQSIPVRVVCDKLQSSEKHSLIKFLVAGGVKVKYGHQRGICHDKFTIVDGQSVETGSFNYTMHADMANHENLLFINDWPDVVRDYHAAFEEIWANGIPLN